MRLRFLSRRAGGRTGLRLPYLSGSALSGSPRHCRALLLVTGLLFAGLEAQGQGAEPLQALRLRGLTARPAALLMSGQSGGEVPLAVLALPMPPTGGESPVAVILEIGLEALASRGEGELRTEVYLYATDPDGAPRDSLTQVFTVPLERLEGEGAAVAVRFLGHLELAPGAYDLRVLVVGRSPDLFGLHRAPLEVPDAGAGAFLLPPLVTEASSQEGWLPVREAPHGKFRQDPLASLRLESWPSVRPVLPAGWEGELVVKGMQMGPLPGDLFGRLEAPTEVALGGSPLVSATLASPSGGLEAWRLKVRLEPTGSGLAKWSWESSVEGVALPPPREVWLASSSEVAGQPWPRLLGSAPGRGSSPVVEAVGRAARAGQEEARKLKEKDLQRVRERYPEILRKVAEGRSSQAMDDLAELEGEIVTGRSLPAVDSLREAEMTVLMPIARKDADSVVPVIWLYLDLFERYATERELLLAAHARLLIRNLIDLYLGSAK